MKRELTQTTEPIVYPPKILFILLVCSVLGFQSEAVYANDQQSLVCSVNGSQDDFKVYLNQLVYSSQEFSYYQLIDGLTVLVVNNKTRRFNRLSNLNLLPQSTMDPNDPPESYQLFSGQCKQSMN